MGKTLINRRWLPLNALRAFEAVGRHMSFTAGAQALTVSQSAMSRHVGRIKCRDVIGICDFDDPSSNPRFHLLDVQSGKVESLLVAHGRGSDPAHTGWLKQFSNADLRPVWYAKFTLLLND